jgi:hypothetical protein
MFSFRINAVLLALACSLSVSTAYAQFEGLENPPEQNNGAKSNTTAISSTQKSAPKKPSKPIPPPPQTDTRTTDEMAVLSWAGMMYSGTTLLSVGMSVSSSGNKDGSSGLVIGGLAMVGAMGSVLVYGSNARYGQAHALATGLQLGVLQGTLLELAQLYGHEKADGLTLLRWWGIATLGGISGLIAAQEGPTPANASWVGSTGIWSSVLGGSIANVFRKKRYDSSTGTSLLVAGLSVNVGAVAGMVSFPYFRPSLARSRLIDLTILGTSIVPFVQMMNSDHEDSKTWAGVTALSTVAGMGLGLWFTSGMTPDKKPEFQAKPEPISNVTPTLVPNKGGMSVGVQGTWF